MKKLILTMMVLAIFASCDKKEKEAAKDDVKKVGETIEKAATKVADKTGKCCKRCEKTISKSTKPKPGKDL